MRSRNLVRYEKGLRAQLVEIGGGPCLAAEPDQIETVEASQKAFQNASTNTAQLGPASQRRRGMLLHHRVLVLAYVHTNAPMV